MRLERLDEFSVLAPEQNFRKELRTNLSWPTDGHVVLTYLI